MKKYSIIFVILFFYYRKNIFKFFYNFLKKLPYFKNIINKKIKKLEKSIREELNKHNLKRIKNIPNDGLSQEVILSNIDFMKKKENLNNKQISGAIYKLDENHKELMKNMLDSCFKTNPLHPELFPIIRKMEADIINFGLDLFKAPDTGAGSTTMGGTESILLACKTYRDKENKWYPNIVAFQTVHPAFDKACQYFKIELRKSNNLKEFRDYIDSNTICLVASAPCYPYGIIDDIEEVNDLAICYNKNFHIDCCLGGFILPFLEDNKVNFNLEGLTSISLDLHKYAYTPKGSSLILYRSKEFIHSQYYIQPKWCGGIYASPTTLGSKSGLLIAQSWATILYYGKNKYHEYANKIVNATIKLKNEINKIDKLFVYGDPKVCIVAVGSNEIDIYSVVNRMNGLDWHLTNLQNPPGFHLCITMQNVEEIDKFLTDLKKCIKDVNNKKSNKTEFSIYGTTQKIDDEDILIDGIKRYMDIVYE